MEYAYEGDELKGEGRPSIFTEAVVEGLRTGEADLDQDHLVSIDDLYHYVYDRVRDRTPSQTPSIKSDLEGALYLARSSYRRPIKPARLDPDLLSRTEDRYAGIREGAVQELAELLTVRDRSVALAARETLLRMTSDDSRRVAARAQTALEAAEDAEPAAAGAEAVPTAAETSSASRYVEPSATPRAPPPTASPPPAQSPAAPPPRRPRSRRALAASVALAAFTLAAVLVIVLSGGGAGATTTIPADNLTRNPSFEQGKSSWQGSMSDLSPERVPDAPEGHWVMRVSARRGSGSYTIQNSFGTLPRLIAGRTYTAGAWVKGTSATSGRIACLTVRERPTSGEPVFNVRGVRLSAHKYQEVRRQYTQPAGVKQVDVYVALKRGQGNVGDAFLVDAVTLTPSARGSKGIKRC
jgi:hypothetical protein